MAYVIINDKHLEAIANALRKVGGKETYKPREMAPDIEKLAGGTGFNGLLGKYFKGVDVPGAAVELFIKDCVNEDGTLFLVDGMWTGKTIKGDVVIPYGIIEIPDNFFKNTEGITDITFPLGLTTIGVSAFQNAINGPNDTITLGVDVELVKEYAFADNVLKVFRTNDNSEVVIEPYAFQNSSIEEIELNGNVSIGEKAFGHTDYNNDTATLKKVVINGELTSVGPYAFQHNTELTEVDGELKAIPEGLFYKCPELKNVTLSDDITAIPDNAFYWTGLENIVIPANVTTIGTHAFDGCGPITTSANPGAYLSVTWNDKLEHIGDYAFHYCSNFSEMSPFPETLQTIGDYAFDGSSIGPRLKIPSGVKSIGNRAFQGCNNISYLDLDDGLESIGEYAFCNSAVESVRIPGTVTEMGSNLFEGCPYLYSLSFGEGITHIPDSAFAGIGEYASSHDIGVVLPSTLKSIGNNAFAGINNNVDLIFKEGLETIGKKAFYNCAFAREKLTFPSTLQTIGDYAFALDYSDIGEKGYLTTIVLPNRLKTIGQYAFEEQGTLTGNLVIPDTVTSIGNYAFSSCDLNSVTLPAGLKKVPNYLLYYNRNLASVNLPEGLEAIGSSAFSGCNALSNITLPSTLKTIETQAFMNANLTGNITLPGVTSLGNEVFAACTKLTGVTVSENLTSIGSKCFANTAITEFSCPESLIYFAADAFVGAKSNSDYTNDYTSLKRLEFNLSPDHQLAFLNSYSTYYPLRMAKPTSSNKNYITFKGQDGLIPKLYNETSYYYKNIFQHPSVNNANTVISVPWSQSENPASFPWGATNATIIYNNGL